MVPAGLGLLLHDLLYQTETHWVFDRWWQYAKEHYVRLPEAGPPEWVAWYYDPLIDYLCQGGFEAAASLVLYLSPQRYDDAQRLYEWSIPSLFQNPPDPQLLRAHLADPRRFALGLLDASEMGDTARYQDLQALAEELCEPTWDRELGEFSYRFGLSEPYPRVQANAVIMAAEAGGNQAGGRVFKEPDLAQVDPPSGARVGFPRLGISQALYDEAESRLGLATDRPN